MNVRVLLVDDEPALLLMFRRVLELEGWDIATALSAAEAVTMLERERFDLVVTDMRMERRDAGLDVVHAAARLEPRPGIVVLTAYIETLQESLAAGADRVLQKGAPVPVVLSTLKTLLGDAAVAKAC
jgi:CheY-like chemotaxis protein